MCKGFIREITVLKKNCGGNLGEPSDSKASFNPMWKREEEKVRQKHPRLSCRLMNIWKICQENFWANIGWQWNPIFPRKGSALISLPYSVINKEQPVGEKYLGIHAGVNFKAKQLGLYFSYALHSVSSQNLILISHQENILSVIWKNK